jgi:hypothetical protein
MPMPPYPSGQQGLTLTHTARKDKGFIGFGILHTSKPVCKCEGIEGKGRDAGGQGKGEACEGVGGQGQGQGCG